MSLRFIAMIFLVSVSPLVTQAAGTIYFPKGSEKFYPKYLEAMKEPSIFEQSTNKAVEQYRFLWLRSFHKPISIRIWKDESGVAMRVVRLGDDDGDKPGKIEFDQTLNLTTNQWQEFLALLNQATFWKMPCAEKMDVIGFDGSEWVLEGQTAGTYHMVDRWSPNYDYDGKDRHLENFVICCRYLLIVSKLEIPYKEDY